jgi:hypothetical protein
MRSIFSGNGTRAHPSATARAAFTACETFSPGCESIEMHPNHFAHVARVSSRENPGNGNAVRLREFEDAPVAGHQVVMIESER